MNVSFSNGDGGMSIEKPIIQNTTLADRVQQGQVLNHCRDNVWS